MKRLILSVALMTVVIGCEDDDLGGSNVITVRPGQSIQAAVDAAPPGGRVEVMPGEYVETHGGQAAVLVEKSLQLIGLNAGGEVKILPGPGNTEGIWVRGSAAAFVEDILIEGFTVDGFTENGIWTFYVRNFEIRNNKVGNADHVGIYPQLSAQGLVQDNTAFGGLDSAMWVSGSEDIRVLDNEAYGAPIGLQVNVSKNVDVDNITAYGNVTGIAFTHPLASGLGDDVDLAFGYRSESVRLANSTIFDNNLVNPVTSGSVGALPRGTGVLIAGHDRAYVEDNSLTDNDYTGLVMVDYCLVTGETDEDCKPDSNTIVRNTITGNGTNPPPSDFMDLASDVIVVAPEATGNCMADNTYDTNVGADAIEAESCPPFSGF